ncbi:MAG: amino acid adenylation domain-containing protein, partial [Acidobacteriota bacterium]|nr:amino acid adenylation domain-containing protein [Acidobacteriota bacterium]
MFESAVSFPASFAQRRLWLLDALDAGHAAYAIPAAFRLEGPLDRDALERALQALAGRHEALRTTFGVEDGRPVQRIETDGRLTLVREDLSGLPAGERAAVLRSRLATHACEPFDLARGPLFRARLFILGPAEHVLALSLHHIAGDAWSFEILLRELGHLYAACRAHRPPDLPELDIQYADYADFQQRQVESEAGRRALEYWRERLAGPLPVSALPVDRPRPAAQSHAGATVTRRLPRELVGRLDGLARDERVSRFMLMLAVFKLLVQRCTGQPDVIVGTPIANRTHPQTRDVVGLFLNTLALRTSIDGAAPFREILSRVRQTCLEAYEHEDCPFELVVEAVAPARDLSRPPIFQNLFVYLEDPGNQLALDGLAVTPLPLSTATAKFDLTLTLERRDGEIAATVEYCTDLFEPETAEAVLAHYERLCAAVCDEPGRAAGDLAMLPADEEALVLRGFNGTSRRDPDEAGGATVVGLFEAQAARTPLATAVIDRGRSWSYRALNEEANRLAWSLVEAGVGPGTLVGICLERSIEMVAAVIGVLKAGAAYLPLDPVNPDLRLRALLDDAGTRVVITQRSLAPRVAAEGVRLLDLEAPDGWRSSHAPVDPGLGIHPESPIYVLYTSGSTGRPKGTVLPHRAMTNLIRWHLRTLTGGQRTLQLASLGFDASFHEFFATLGSGGSLVLVPEEVRRDPEALAGLLTAERVEKAIVPVVVLSQLAERLLEQGTDRCALTELTATGEQLVITDAVRRFFAQRPACALWNHYGPTETHVVTAFRLAGAPADWSSHPSIGRPIDNTGVRLLDARLRPVPIGVPGRLYISGPSLATCYLGRPALTAERFLPDPFADAPGERMYDTGDLARWGRDGCLEFLGRIDDQIKIRGHRVELGEVESALGAHPEVRQAVVLVRDLGAARQLVAYLVVERDAITLADIRDFLADRLPDYMIPAHFVVLDRLPLNKNGKVDRAVLPAPEDRALGVETEYVAPRTELERVLVAILARALGVRRVGVHDDFFALGGHSLSAARVVALAQQRFLLPVQLRDLFARPTVAQLAQAIAQREPFSGVALERAPAAPHHPLSHAQRRLWVLEQMNAGGAAAYNVPGAFLVHGPLSVEALRHALAALTARHDILRTRIVVIDGEPRQEVVPSLEPRIDEEDWSAEPGADERFGLLAARESAAGFVLGEAPLWRVSIRRLPPGPGGRERHGLLLVFHHLLLDGRSLPVLADELEQLYRAARRGEPDGLPPLGVQYADYVRWQQALLSAEAAAPLRAYWHRQFAEPPEPIELPHDRPRPAVLGTAGDQLAFALADETRRGMEALCREQGATPFMAVLAGVYVLLMRHSGQEDITLGTPVAGRLHPALERQVGFYVNTLALRLRTGRSAGFRALLDAVRDVVSAGLEHQIYPFDRLVDELALPRDASRNPLFDVMVALHTGGEPVLRLDGAGVEPMAVAGTTSKFELSFDFFEEADRLRGLVEFSTELYTRERVARMCRHLDTLLRHAVAEPDRPVGDLPLLPDDERAVVVSAFNPWREAGAAEATVLDLFRAAVAVHAGRPAVVCDERTLGYAELDARSDRLAQRLREAGAGPDGIVAVLMPRSEQLIVALLGILKAGSAFLPIDVNLPEARVRQMLDDCAARAIVTDEGLAAAFEDASRVIVDLGAGVGRVEDGAGPFPPVGIDGDALAYVIYTSGSSGRPKGVMIDHRSLALHTRRFRDIQGLGPQDRVLQYDNIAFDQAIEEIFPALAAGATLFVRGRDLWTPGELHAYLERHRITVAELPTAYWHEAIRDWAGRGRQPAPGSLRLMLVGGEALTAEGLAQWRAVHAARVPLANTYGPTEASVTSAYHLFPPGPALDEDGWRVPIGRGLGGQSLYVLDDRLEPVGIGMPGELCIGGAGLARGYLGQADLTAERFVPDPFAPQPGGRLYRTGDVVAWRADGTLVYLGRDDGQVKVRGFRIELGEIERALRTHEAVRDALVVARTAGPTHELVAYVVADAPAVEDLRAHLRRRLPEYMVPALLVCLDSFPLTSRGKIDRARLPGPSGAARPAGGAARAPRTGLERTLTAIWRRALDLGGDETIGPDENFFALGGHSLTATRVVSRAREDHALDLRLTDVFTHPTIAEQARLLVTRDPVGSLPLVPLPLEATYPVSHAQRRLWIIEQLAADGPAAYNMPAAFLVHGELNRDALVEALTRLTGRHEALRTRLVQVEGEPRQEVRPAETFQIDEADWSDDPGARERFTREAERWMYARFDLAEAPPFEVVLRRLAASCHGLVIVLHHAFADGWSIPLIVSEIVDGYADALRGIPPRAAALTRQYKDYAAWQQALLESPGMEETRAYWHRQFETPPEPLALPTDRPRPAVQRFDGGRATVELGAGLLDAIDAFAHAHAVSRFVVLLAAVNVLLMRVTGQHDVTVGSPVAGRTHPALEQQVGFFVNTLALRSRPEPDLSFAAYAAGLGAIVVGALEHQIYPFDRLVDELDLDRDVSRSPLVDVMVALQEIDERPLTLEGTRVEPLDLPRRVSQFDLGFTFTPAAGGLRLDLDYAAALFEPSTAGRLGRLFQVLLEAALRNPEARLDGLPLLDPAARQQLLVEFNASGLADGQDSTTVLDLFAQQVRARPDAAAVVCGGRVLTYGELDLRAGRLARILVERCGVRRGEIVALQMDRSEEMIVGLLGVLRAGAVYLPMDPAHPAGRWSRILRDGGARIVLLNSTDDRGASDGAIPEGVTAIPLPALDTGEVFDLLPAVDPDEPAYTIYTSGSTGAPKGVSIPHRALANVLASMQRTPGLRADDVLAAVTTWAFDIAALEVFLPLVTGARVVVVDRETAGSGEALAGLLERQGVTVMQATPATWQLLVDGGWAPATKFLAWCGGERLPDTLGASLLERGVELWNVYGPTETTIWSAVNQVREAAESGRLGGPIARTQLYVLDEALEPVPVGVRGEIYIGGAGLGFGYHRAADLTAERYVPSPFARGERLYRTGDEGRWLENGQIEFLGRRDFQLKLRGYRIEPAEIERALRQHPQVADAVVMLRPGDEAELCAFFVASGERPALDVLRDLLAAQLPDYMIPARYVPLDAWPLTPAGKIDRAALLRLETGGLATGARYRAPRTATERALVRLWQDVLDVERVGLDDNFFHLGGQSLRATRIVARASSELGLDLTLRDLFARQTVGALAELVSRRRSDALVPLAPADRADSYPLSHAQRRLWVLEQLAPAPFSAYNMPSAFLFETRLRTGDLERTFRALIDRHEALRTRFIERDGEPRQVVEETVAWTLDVDDWSERPDAVEDFRRAVREWAHEPFALEVAPLLRVKVRHLAAGRSGLFVLMHHLVTDGASTAILVRELMSLYDTAGDVAAAGLEPLPVQYRDYAVWQRRYLESPAAEPARAFWTREFADPPEPLQLPQDFPRPALQSFDGAAVRAALPLEVTAGFRRLVRSHGASLFAGVLGSIAWLLGRLSGQADISVGMPVEGRGHPALEPPVGFFANTLPLRLALRGTDSFADLLRQCRDKVAQALDHQVYPFDRLVDELRLDRDLGRSPLFDVMVVLQEAGTPDLILDGRPAEPVPAGDDVSRFDLTFVVREAAGGLELGLEYNTALFAPGTARRIAGCWMRIVESLAAGTDAVHRPLASIDILDASERRRLVERSRAPQPVVPSHGVSSILDLFDEVVARQGDQCAIVAGDVRLTYRELNERATRVASVLARDRDVGPERVVGVRAGRTADTITGILGILKAGGAYLPVAAGLPAERVAYMLEAAGAVACLTAGTDGMASRAPRVPSLDLATLMECAPSDRPPQGPLPESLAYIIYTSGSTGWPKGVGVGHNSLLDLALGAAGTFYTDAGHPLRVCVNSSLAFDASVQQLVGALCWGHTLFVPADDVVRNPVALADYLRRHAIELCELTPTLLESLLQSGVTADTCPALRCLIVGGESLDWRTVARFYGRSISTCVLRHQYGPTEASVFATELIVESGTWPDGRVPIGPPARSASVLVLDPDLNPAPDGVWGEVCLGGPGVARGYAGDPGLTAERFIPDPVSGPPGARLYRTGDRARWRPDGMLEYGGRLDRQV